MNVIRARENMSVDGGNCYVIAGGESFGIKPFTANYSFQKADSNMGMGGLDLMLSSVAKVFKNRSAAVILSGDTYAGVEGVKMVMAMSGSALMLNPVECYCKEMGMQVRKHCPSIKILDEDELISRVEDLHYRAKMTVSAD
jgi:chemotaxis response regulator CheB